MLQMERNVLQMIHVETYAPPPIRFHVNGYATASQMEIKQEVQSLTVCVGVSQMFIIGF